MPFEKLLAYGAEKPDIGSDAIEDMDLNRQEKLLWIASEYFLTKGYLATSVDEIAEAAGTTGPALYRVFDSKQAILDEICLVAVQKRIEGVEAAIAQNPGDPLDTLRNLVKTRIEFAFGPWGYQVPITLAEARHLSPHAGKMIATASERGTAEWFRCLVQIRPEVPTDELLTIIYAVLMEITYVAFHFDDLGLKQDVVRPYLENMAMAALIPTE